MEERARERGEKERGEGRRGGREEERGRGGGDGGEGGRRGREGERSSDGEADVKHQFRHLERRTRTQQPPEDRWTDGRRP